MDLKNKEKLSVLLQVYFLLQLDFQVYNNHYEVSLLLS